MLRTPNLKPDLTLMRRMLAATGCLTLLAGLAGCATPPPPAPTTAPSEAVLRELVLKVIKDNPKVVLETLQAYQKEATAAAQQSEEDKVRAKIAALDLHGMVGESPTRGAPGGKVLMFEFADFQCPYCARASDTVRKFVDAHADEVTLVYKHLPLTDIHPEAENAARAAFAAQRQQKFWEYHDALYAREGKLDEAAYVAIAKSLGLDLARFDADRRGDAATTALQRDLLLGTDLGIGATPAFLLGREPFAGALPREALEEILANVKAAALPPGGLSTGTIPAKVTAPDVTPATSPASGP